MAEVVSFPDLVIRVLRNVYLWIVTARNKSGDDCDELDAYWMTVCQLFLEIYNTHKPYSEVEWHWLAYWNHYDTISCFQYMHKSLVFLNPVIRWCPALRLGSFAQWIKVAGNHINSVLDIRTWFDRPGTRSSQPPPDLLRWVFVAYTFR